MKTANANERRQGTSGMGVDIHGGPVIDPTKNVLDLVDASVRRLDDMTLLRAELVAEKILRLERQIDLITQMATMRAEHQKDLDALESKRLDAMRQVDQIAVKTEADRASTAITALAAAASTTAETLRSAVNTSATNLATQLDRTVTAITERIAALEKSSYTGQGKQAVVDPQVTEMLMEMRALRTTQAQGAGKGEGINLAWVVLLGVVSLVVGLLAIGSFIFVTTRAPAVAAAAPQVIYVPSPPGTLLPSVPPSQTPR
jgi:hypothetical protein